MKRSDFLKKIGLVFGAVAIAPKVLAEMPAKEEAVYTEGLLPYIVRINQTFRYMVNDLLEHRELGMLFLITEVRGNTYCLRRASGDGIVNSYYETEDVLRRYFVCWGNVLLHKDML